IFRNIFADPSRLSNCRTGPLSMDPVASPVDLIEEWRREASIFSSTDRLGNLISRSLEVLKGLARKELSFSDLEYSLESLDMERTLALKHDKAKDTDQVRSLMYGVIESIGLSVHAMISNDRIMKSEEASVEDPLTSQMDTSLEEMNASSALSDVSTSHGTPSTSHQQAHAEKDKRRSGSAILEDKQGPAKRPRMDDHGVIEHHPQQYHFASASPHFPAGDQHRPSMAPSSSSFTHPIKDEEESLFGEGVIIKEENVSPVDFVERPVYEPSQYTQWCHLYANTGPSTSSGSHPTDYFSNCLGPTAHMYESMYQPGSCHAGLNKNEIHQPSPAKSTASDDLNSKPFACEECGKTFASLRWKQNHIRNVHSASKIGGMQVENMTDLLADKTKFECTICGMRFTDRSNQRRHIRRQHELRCTVCDEKFDNKRAFEEHIWVVHGMRQQA
ncbi:hypothetical protein PRIPAC_87602, partial [Pristionchus pacificus]